MRTGEQQILQFQDEQQVVDVYFKGLQSFHLVGPELLLGKTFDQIGFGAINDDLFRHLVITRLVYSVSKLKTTEPIQLQKQND